MKLLLSDLSLAFIGPNVLFFVLSIFNKEISIEEIRGEDTDGTFMHNDIMNALVGLISFAVVVIPFMYLINLIGWL
ncbi:hypothetical protein NMK71_07655 [Weeksellaceae bacterium KMM 9713]|uniref:Uncharacterized protein n=1 Tax=Profundicola chukchiensis TaxID=2961959 RepID=A0A9X4MZ58_9FLAO|nr:hypothetical protein [Profundicola chukchiensis]MDG4946285.1 hypothetical protein [Profundicola chukchiensis]